MPAAAIWIIRARCTYRTGKRRLFAQVERVTRSSEDSTMGSAIRLIHTTRIEPTFIYQSICDALH